MSTQDINKPMSKYLDYQHSLRTLIEYAGGTIHDRFVLKPGCLMTQRTENMANLDALYHNLNIDTNQPKYEQNLEMRSRLTYLSFPNLPNNSQQFNYDMVTKYGHLSVVSDHNVTFLIAGVTIETALELISHTEAKVSRLTTSKTLAMSETFYRVFGQEQGAIEDFIQLRQKYLDAKVFPNLEIANMFNLGSKVTALTFSMNLKDYHKFFIGRLPTNNEQELREVATIMCQHLHGLYPLVIKAPVDYIKSSNHQKYQD